MVTSSALLIAAPCATFTSTLLRGFQQRAVATNNKKQAFLVGSAMNACDLLVIAVIASHSSSSVVLASAIGAGCGWVAGMKLHDRINKRRRDAIKAQKKLKREKRVIKVVQQVLSKDQSSYISPEH